MKENVLHGVALLDEKVPDWRKRIDSELLSMVWCGRCILGQLFGGYGNGLIELEIGWDMEKAVYYGFDVFDVRTQSEKSKKWNKLTQLWKEQL